MKKADFAGAGVMLFIWVVAFVVPSSFEASLGEWSGFLMLALLAIGVWAGYQTRRELISEGKPAAGGTPRSRADP